jgi:very-short-patch-repair endonuclease
MKKLTTEEFISRARIIHRDKYNYSKVVYNHCEKKVCIVCNTCKTEFWQTPNVHLSGGGCPTCAIIARTFTKDTFIEKSKIVHGENRYDYSKVIYDNSKIKVCIICNTCGSEFWQTPCSHLQGCGCPNCRRNYDHTTTTLEDFIEKSKYIHKDKYDYSKVIYKNRTEKVCIVCNTCENEFWQSPSKHLLGRGCPNCKLTNLSTKFRKPLNDFINQANRIHNFRYDYSKVSFKNLHDRIVVICPVHGEFVQEAQSHLQGCRCPICSRSSHLEDDVRYQLKLNKINFEEQKTWDWLVYNSNQFTDFYLPDYNIVIECQGVQHFEPVEFFGGEENFRDLTLRDKNKLDLCIKNGIDVLYYSNLGEDYNYPYEVFTSTETLINKIKGIDLTNQF